LSIYFVEDLLFFAKNLFFAAIGACPLRARADRCRAPAAGIIPSVAART
jgi:hypothetical protein